MVIKEAKYSFFCYPNINSSWRQFIRYKSLFCRFFIRFLEYLCSVYVCLLIWKFTAFECRLYTYSCTANDKWNICTVLLQIIHSYRCQQTNEKFADFIEIHLVIYHNLEIHLCIQLKQILIVCKDSYFRSKKQQQQSVIYHLLDKRKVVYQSICKWTTHICLLLNKPRHTHSV